MPKPDLPILLVKDLPAWSHWLHTNASSSPGVWLVMAKKGTTVPTSLSLADALDEALCFGWINGQARRSPPSAADTVQQRYTPRTPRSTWSQVNVAHIARLRAAGRMQPRGEAEVARAVADGRWEAAYGRFSEMEAEGDLRRAIEGVRGGWERWMGWGKGERYAVLLRWANLRTEKGREALAERTVERLEEELGKGEEGNGERKAGKVVKRGKRKRGDVEVAREEMVRPEPSLLRETRTERAERRARER